MCRPFPGIFYVTRFFLVPSSETSHVHDLLSDQATKDTSNHSILENPYSNSIAKKQGKIRFLGRIMKPQLPSRVEAELPDDILKRIYMFVPHFQKKKHTKVCSISPTMEKDLRLIQNSKLFGKNEMYMRDFDDFILR